MDYSLLEIYKEEKSDMKYIIYGDTDSFFTDLTDYYKKIYGLSDNELRQLLIYDLNNKLDESDKLKECLNNCKKIADTINKETISNMYNFFKSKCNNHRENTINFKFEYVSSFYRPIARKSYVYKEILKNNIKKKNFGVKRTDPIFTKKILDKIISLMFMYGNNDMFFISITPIIKEYIKNLEKFDQTTGLPIAISTDISKYKTLTAQMKSLINYLTLRHLCKEIDNVTLPLTGVFEYKGFRFKVKPTSKLNKYNDIVSIIYKKFESINKKIVYKPQHLTELFIPDNIYFSDNKDELLKVIRSYFEPDSYEMISSSIYTYIERLSNVNFHDGFHKYIMTINNNDDIDINIIKRYIKINNQTNPLL